MALPTPIPRGILETVFRTSRETEPSAGYLLRRNLNYRNGLVREIFWPLMTQTQLNTLRTLFRAQLGSAGEFSWQGPKDVASIRWHFMSDTLRVRRRRNPGIYTAHIIIEQVLPI